MSTSVVVTIPVRIVPFQTSMVQQPQSEAEEPVVIAAHMVLFFASSFSGAAARRYCKNETRYKPLMYVYVDRHWGAEFPAIAEGSAPMLGTTVRGAGSAVGHIDPTRWEQAHGRRRQQAYARSTRRWRSPSA